MGAGEGADGTECVVSGVCDEDLPCRLCFGGNASPSCRGLVSLAGLAVSDGVSDAIGNANTKRSSFRDFRD